jgi:hypothetical protein
MEKVIVSATATISLLLNVAALCTLVFGAIQHSMDLVGASFLIELISAIVSVLLFFCVFIVFDMR